MDMIGAQVQPTDDAFEQHVMRAVQTPTFVVEVLCPGISKTSWLEMVGWKKMGYWYQCFIPCQQYQSVSGTWDIYFAKKIGGSDPEHFDNLKAYFKLSTISEEYYLYGKSYVEQSEAIDFSLFVEPVSVFSNINNGYGIFAGYGQCTDSVFYNKWALGLVL